MANIKFVGMWSKPWQKQYNIPRGYLLIKPKEIYIKRMAGHLKKLNELQEKKKEIKELDITIEYHYQKRKIEQNNLMWALYAIEANEMNAGMKGAKSQMVTSEQLYHTDLLDYGPRMKLQIKKELLNMVKAEYEVIEEKETENKELIVITVILTTSKLNTKQMAEWIDRIFNRMACNGVTVTSPDAIYDYWLKWRENLNNEKIILHDNILAGGQYKALNPLCEATGNYIGNNNGQLCHIKAKGMGGNPEKEKDHVSNWLHLSTEAHINTQHQKGWRHFLKLYPHLKYKVETALRREYLDENESEKNKKGESINEI